MLEENSVPTTSHSRTQGTSGSSEVFIKKWLYVFGAEHKEEIASRLPIWLEAFGQIDTATLGRLFERALKTCKFFPKVAEILAPLTNAEANAAPEAAQRAWQSVLEIRRLYWNPDIPGPFDLAIATLSDRVQRAARASGVFREFTAEEYESGALHTWAKKRFVESFISYEETEQASFLLPDGEIKQLIRASASAKGLPAPQLDFNTLHDRGLQYAAQVKAQPAVAALGKKKLTIVPPRMSIEEQKEELRRRGLLPKS